MVNYQWLIINGFINTKTNGKDFLLIEVMGISRSE